MPRRFQAWLTCLLIIFVIGCCSSAYADELFPDKALEAAVRQHVFAKRDDNQPLTADDVKSISTIVAKEKGIKDLKGLEACAALALLDWEGNEISSVAPLANLTMLQSLNLARNRIQDAGPLAELTNLQYLHLAGNQIADISALAKLENLTTFYLSNNQIKDIAPVAGNTKLWSLHIDGNEVKDLSPIANLTGLTTLNASGCGITDLSPLKELNQWQFLIVRNNEITDLGPLAQMATKDAAAEKRFAPFWRIYLEGNPLSEAAKTTQAEQIKKLGGRVVLE